jgi:redox-sensitive bicupin YhaK (pirin superfamily)
LRNIAPRYQQQAFEPAERNNKLQIVVSPEQESGALLINQDAWFSLGKFDAGKTVDIVPKMEQQGSYLFVLEGEIEVAGEVLQRRDAIALTDFDQVTVKVLNAAEFLLIDVPMN